MVEHDRHLLVPVIDLRDPDAPAAVDAAASSVGFLQLVGHGIEPKRVEPLLTALADFFALPLAAKSRYVPTAPGVNNGYSAIGSESLAYSLGVSAPPDLFEAFNIDIDEPDLDDPAVVAEIERIFAPNLWPAEIPELRSVGMAYFEEVRALAHRVTSLFAVALGLDPAFFEEHTRHSTDTLRCNWYERAPGAPEPLPGQLRMGPHTDYGIVTLLWADPVAGLEIVGPDGQWVGVVPEPGALLVNIGDLLAQWTNDRWRSTVHRVVPPPVGTDGGARRRSMAFFHDGDWDALVEYLPTCCSADNPARYDPVRALDHLMNKLLGGRTMIAAEETAHLGDRREAVAEAGIGT